MTQPLYTPRHKLSRYRGHTVAVLIRPSSRRRPNNVLCRDLASGDLFTCPWRGLRRIRKDHNMDISDLIGSTQEREFCLERHIAYGCYEPDGTYALLHAPTQLDLDAVAAVLAGCEHLALPQSDWRALCGCYADDATGYCLRCGMCRVDCACDEPVWAPNDLLPRAVDIQGRYPNPPAKEAGK